MISFRSLFLRIVLVASILLAVRNVSAQSTDSIQTYYDTTNYLPAIYEGSLEYNLMIAASGGYVLEIDRLIKKGADINAETSEGATPLILAVSNNQVNAVNLLIKNGSNVNKVTTVFDTPLIIAVKNQNSEIAEALIRAGADINQSDRFDATPLHYASIYGYFELVDLLLYYDASIEKKTAEGTTPLTASIWAGNADVADLLIQHGANMEARDNEGFTPFMMAAYNGDTLLMDLLYKKGVDIYATNALKQNALTVSIRADQKNSVEFLLKIGNKWTDKGKDSIDPYSVASVYRRDDIIELLQANNIPGKLKHEIDQVDIMLSSRFCFHDIYTGVSLAFKEPYLNGGIIVGLDTKPLYSRVLLKNSEHLFYQYMDKGSVIYAGLFKDFELTDYAFKGNFEINTSLSGGYTFGNKLKGTLITPENKFILLPSVALKWTKKSLSFSLGLDYIKTQYYHVGPVWLRLGASYNLFFDNVRTKEKNIKWY